MNTIIGLLRKPEARLFYLANFMGNFCEGFFCLSSILYVAKTAGSPLALGNLLVLTMLPSFLLGGFCGVLIDRFNRATLAAIGNFGRLAAAAGAFAVVVTSPHAIGAFESCVGLYYLFWYVSSPNTDSLLRHILAPEEFVTGSSFLLLVLQVGMTSALVSAGFMVGRFGIPTTFAAVVVCMALSSICFWLISRLAPPEATASRTSFWQSFTEGFSFFWRIPAVLPYALGLLLVLPVCQAVNVLLAPLVLGRLHGTSLDVGLTDGGLALGSVLAAWGCMRLADKAPLPVICAATAGTGLMFGLLPFAHSVWTALLLFAAMGIGLGAMKAFSRGHIYVLIENQWIGRVSSLISTVSIGVAMMFAFTTSALATVRPEYSFFIVSLTLLLAALVMTPAFGRLCTAARFGAAPNKTATDGADTTTVPAD